MSLELLGLGFFYSNKIAPIEGKEWIMTDDARYLG
jgi:hypothetical protein